jgi:hypothetical protein
MINVLKPGGFLFLSFPATRTVNFPIRNGCGGSTLNYYDDTTHRGLPPDYENIIKTLESNNMEIIYKRDSYSPFFLRFLGFLLEPLSKIKNKVVMGTWEYYGFESVIWARKKHE